MGRSGVAEPGTTVLLCYDDRSIYVAFRCLESDRALPRGFLRAHDDRVFEDDCVYVFLAPEDIAKAKGAQISYGGYAGAYDTWFTAIAKQYEFTELRGQYHRADDVRVGRTVGGERGARSRGLDGRDGDPVLISRRRGGAERCPVGPQPDAGS